MLLVLKYACFITAFAFILFYFIFLSFPFSSGRAGRRLAYKPALDGVLMEWLLFRPSLLFLSADILLFSGHLPI